MANVRLTNLCKRFANGAPVLDGVNIEVPDGAFCVLLGPSGCGKSTLLRIVAGLDDATSGDVFIGAQRANEQSPKDRNIAMVFQSYALYPHLSVLDNIAFPLEARGVSRKERRARAAKVAESVQLGALLERKPAQLSGGQRQRVALARAIIREPAVFLFDEPLSNLDAAMRHAMRVELRALHQRLGVTSLYVTHDQEEALALADRIVVLSGGRVQQIGTPHEVYHAPANRFVASFVGTPAMNFVRCTVRAHASGASLAFEGGVLQVPESWAASLAPHDAATCWLGVRPTAHRLASELHDVSLSATLAMRVASTEMQGDYTDLHGTGPGGMPWTARIRSAHPVAAGGLVSLAIDFRACHVFADGAGDAQSAPRLCGGASTPALAQSPSFAPQSFAPPTFAPATSAPASTMEPSR